MLLELFNESFSGYGSDVNVPEASNEGLEFEFGGFGRAIAMSESAMHKFRMTDLFIQAKGVQAMSESVALSESEKTQIYQLQENFITTGIEKIKQIIMKLWKNIKEVFNSIYLYFSKIFNKGAFLSNAKKQLEGASDFKGLEFEGYNYTVGALDAGSSFEDMRKAIDKVTVEAENAYKSIAGGSATKASEISSNPKTKDLNNKISEMSGDKLNKLLAACVNNSSYDNLTKTIFKALRSGKDTKTKLTFSKSDCFKAIEELSSFESEIKEKESSVDTAFKQAISELDDAISKTKEGRDAQNEGGKAYTDLKIKICTAKSSALHAAASLSSKIVKMQIEAYREKASQSISFIHEAIKQNKKNVKEANKKSNLNASTNILDDIMNRI